MLRRILLAAAVLLAGCAQNPATGKTMFTTVSGAQEREVGQTTAEQALKLHGMYKPESRVTQYVTNLCERMWSVTEMAAQPISCILLNSEEVNAWATPGYVNVYKGFLPYITTEAQLAAVIGHEAGHVNARHIARHITNGTLLSVLAGVGTAYVAASTGNDDSTALAASAGSAATGIGMSAYGRNYEREADSLAQRYMAKAGYDPRETVSMVDAMLTQQAYDTQLETAFNSGKPPSRSLTDRLYATHPPTPERRANALEQAGGEPDGSVRLPEGTQPATPKADPQGRRRYHEAIEGLEFGPPRKYGIAGRGYLVIPSQRVRLALPDGFVMQYIPSGKPDEYGGWRGVHPQSDVRLEVFLKKFQGGMNAGNALKDMFQIIDSVGEVQRLPLTGGLTVYTTIVRRGNVWDNRTYRVIAIPLAATDKMMVVDYSFPTGASQQAEEPAILAITQTSEIFTKEKAAAFQPLKVHTFTAAAGDTVANRAAQLPTGALAESWFRTLNNLPAPQEMTPGEIYKTILDPNTAL